MTDRHREIVLPEGQLQRELREKTHRGFLVGGLAAIGAIGAYEWVTTAKSENEVPWPQRRMLQFNGKLAHGYLSDAHLMPTYPLDRVGYLKPNGNVGLEQPLTEDEWSLELEPGSGLTAVKLQLADIQALPKAEMITNFCCIEGWSVISHWGGARLSDFTAKYLPAGRPIPDYVYMATPGEDYYVGLDAKSALHPQTLLAYEKDGKPLTANHGAPLRLVIPVKYGIKNIKRIGLIRYTDKKPGDYWADEGYDWFAGL
jgi:DMSO/TMAO reductase YedYZ molybdopterin-dependent catalytic subunit